MLNCVYAKNKFCNYCTPLITLYSIDLDVDLLLQAASFFCSAALGAHMFSSAVWKVPVFQIC